MIFVAWGALLVVVLLMAEASKSWLLAWVFYVLLVLVALAYRVARRPAQIDTVRRNLPTQHAEIGQSVFVEVAFHWKQRSGPGWVLVQDSLPPSLRVLGSCGRLFVAGAASEDSLSYRVVGEQRGYFPIGPLTMTSGDLFGFAQATGQIDDSRFLTVYPRIVPVPTLRIPSNRPLGDVRSHKRIFEDATRPVGIREYQPGDGLSKIHWKTTARTGELSTKVCEPSCSTEVNIVLNLFEGDYPEREYEVELACSTAASVAANLLLDKHDVGLQCNGNDAAWRYQPIPAADSRHLKMDNGRQQFVAILSLLGRMELSSAQPLAEYLTQMHSRLPWTATTLLITHYLNDESALALEALKRSGLELAVIIVGAGEYAEASMDRVAAMGIPVATAQTEKQLAYLEFRRPER